MQGFYLPFILVLQGLFECKGDKAKDIDPTSLKMYDQEMEVTYGELNLGKDYFEGDILLTPQQRDYIERSWQKSTLDARALVKDTRKLWTNKVVPFELSSDLSGKSRGYIDSAIKEWENKTCIRFKPREYEADYIEFVYEVGCSSYVGRIGGHQTISVGNSDGSVVCRHGNIVHEIAHSLGFFHEHSRPDRDDYVEVKWDNVEEGYEKNFFKESVETVDSRSVSYDYDSVMHYGEFFFTKVEGLRTIEPKLPGAAIGQRIGLSIKDEKQGNLLYECPGFEMPANETLSTSSVDNELWDSQHPLRDREVKVLRSKVQKHKGKSKPSNYGTSTESSLHRKGKKPGLLKDIIKTKKAASTKGSTKKITRVIGKSRSIVLNGNQASPQDNNVYKNDADTLEGDDDEDPLPSVRAVSAPDGSRGLPTQLATDRATLAQEEEDAMQQQDNDEIGEENLGKGYFEGDMILTPQQQTFLDQMKEGSGTEEPGTKRALIRDNMYLWPKATVYWNFHKGVDRKGRRRARAAMKHWQKHTCLKFKRVKDPPKNLGYIEFVFEGGCASRVGRGGPKRQKLTIGSPALRCKIGNIIHELGHAVGFFHEHSRPDRNKYVRVMKKNILPGYERNFFRFSKKWIDSRDVPYDYGSIMHYNRAFFSRFPVMLDTIIPLHRNVDIGQRKALSKFDILQANLLYQCDGRKRLTADEIEQLKEESEDQLEEAYCADVYDRDSCESIKTNGYCQKFPITMRTTCGITCNLCGKDGNSSQSGATVRNNDVVEHDANHKSAISKLKSAPLKEETGSKRTFPVKKP